ncbi:MAG: fibronectin type III domain-containing protein [Betaproteobacteria bacterium]|nr:fibronectin type III domain-containing protein [Betaproteobacteria bacterium]
MLHPTSSGLNGSRPRRVPPAPSPSRAPWRITLATLALGTLAGCGSSGGGGTGTEPDNAALASPPAAVSGLVATVGNSPSITLRWIPSAGADAYNVYWSESRGVTPSTAKVIREASSPFLHDGLPAGKPYHYIVTAVNAAGESAPSAEVSALLPPGAPTSVTALPGDSINTVSWQAVPHAEQYRIYWSTQPNVNKSNGSRVDAATNPLVHTGLQNGSTYYYVVTAVGAGGEGPVSQQVSASPRVPVPGAPRDLTAQASSDTERSVALSWQAPTIPANIADILGYRVYRSVQPDIAANLSAATRIDGSTQTTLADSVPIGGITYYYIVTALTAAGESAPSAEVSTTATGGGGDSDGSGGGSGGGGSFDCGEPIACWQDSTPR